MASPFIASVVTGSATKYIFIDPSASSPVISLNTDLSVLSKNISAKLTVPDRPLSCAVFGISEDGSVKCAKLLAKRLLLNVAKSFSSEDARQGLVFGDVDFLVVCGGYNNSGDAGIKKMILDISSSESFLKNRPAVIFSGSVSAVSFAQYRFSPFTDFFNVESFIENPAMILDTSLYKKMFLRKYPGNYNNDIKKADRYQYFDVLSRFSEVLCGTYSSNAVTIFIAESFSVMNLTERAGSKYFNKMYLVNGNTDSLKPDFFSSGYVSFLNSDSQDNDPFKERFEIMPLTKGNREDYLRPDRIGCISVCSGMSFEKFADLIFDPVMIKGVIEFTFDKDGLYAGAGLMFLESKEDFSDWLQESSSSDSFVTGWIVIPDGSFINKKEALSVYINGSGHDVVGTYRWGKRYFLTVEPFSIIEIQVLGKVSFGGSQKKKILKSGKARRTIVIDLRKEKSE